MANLANDITTYLSKTNIRTGKRKKVAPFNLDSSKDMLSGIQSNIL